MLRRRHRLLAVLTAVLLVLAGCGDDDAGDDAAPTSTTAVSADDTTTTKAAASVDPLDASELGPYSVGRRTVTVTDPANDGRELVTDIWYPTDVTDGEASTYSFAPGIEYDSEVALDSPAVSADGPFPLVVYSHGSGGLRYVASYFTETLASYGVVVVAPDHAGNTTVDQFLDTTDSREVIARNRPLDVSAVITAMIDGSVDAEITGAVDPDHIGVTGHSLGGYTTLAIGGGVDAVPVEADDRVDALVAMAPAAGGLSDDDLASVDIPTMVISGTLDTTTPIDPNTERTTELVTGRPLVRVDLEGATHQSFTDVCDYTVLLRELPDVSQDILDLVDQQAGNTCDPEVLDVDRAQELIDDYAIAFLLAELTDDPSAQAALDAPAPDEVDLRVEG